MRGATHQDEDLFDFLLYVRTDFVPNVEFIDVQIRAARVDFTPATQFNRGETCEEDIFGNPHNCFSWCSNCGGGRTCPPGLCHRLGTTEGDWLEPQGVFVAELRLFDDDCEDSCDVAVDLIAPDGSILTSRTFTYEDVTENQGDILFIGLGPLDPPPPPSYDELAEDLDACDDDLSSCESDFVDPDSDGVDGRSDACPFTEAGESRPARSQLQRERLPRRRDRESLRLHDDRWGLRAESPDSDRRAPRSARGSSAGLGTRRPAVLKTAAPMQRDGMRLPAR